MQVGDGGLDLLGEPLVNPQIFANMLTANSRMKSIFKLVETGKVTGLRIDHADGLLDPEDYIRRLQSGCF